MDDNHYPVQTTPEAAGEATRPLGQLLVPSASEQPQQQPQKRKRRRGEKSQKSERRRLIMHIVILVLLLALIILGIHDFLREDPRYLVENPPEENVQHPNSDSAELP